MPARFVAFFSDAWSVIVNIFMMVFLFLMPIHNYVNMLVLLITIDFITGISASIRVNGIRSIKASKMSRTVLKLLFYSTAIIATFILQRILNEGTQLPRIAAFYIAATELKSVYENISKVTGHDIVGLLWSTMKEKVDSLITNVTAKNNEKSNL